MRTSAKVLTVILLFALLHAFVSVTSRLLGVSDGLTLTTLTMLMAVALCQIMKSNVLTMIISLIVVNFGGYYLGRYIGKFLHLFLENSMLRGGITTFTTTVALGFIIYLIIAIFKGKDIFINRKEINTYWIMFVFTFIILARLILILLNESELYRENITLSVIIDYTFCSVALCSLAINAINEKRKAKAANELSNMTNYSYIRLQQQVKPHFMFNNLNILNSLITENLNQEASSFIYKLAYLYRYMIENEEENLVTIREELDFVQEYTELMKVRFGTSFNVVTEIEDKLMENFVVPCSVQLLIENALKHNGGTTQTPLNIRISNTSSHIIIWNNRLPKSSCEQTTHLGLKYIKRLYSDLCSTKVVVEPGEEDFVVKLPIIR